MLEGPGSILRTLENALGAPGVDFRSPGLESDRFGIDFGGFGVAFRCLAMNPQAPGNDVTIE